MTLSRRSAGMNGVEGVRVFVYRERCLARGGGRDHFIKRAARK